MATRQVKPLNRRNDVPQEKEHLRVDDRSISDDGFLVGLRDHDEDIVTYIKEKINPSVVQNGNKVSIPVFMGNREVWEAVSNQELYEDNTGKTMIPIISLRRDNVEPNLEYPSKIDGNFPKNFRTFAKTYTKNQPYDQFSALTNMLPNKEYISVSMPDYIIITYSGIVQTNKMSQMNHIIESFLYASNSYWGQFKTKVSGFDNSSQFSVEEERIISNEFTLTVWGNLVPNIEQNKTNIKQEVTPAFIKFKPVVVKTI